MHEIVLDLDLWPKQMMAFQSPCTDLLFGGASEGGKSHFVRVALISWCLAIDGLQCVLIRKKYDDILKNHVESPTGFKKLLEPLLKIKKVKITEAGVYFPNGSIIAFQHCQDERQFTSAQGVEKHVLVIDEATQISERLLRFFKLWVRMPKEMKARLPERFRDKFPCIIYTANPIGASVSYFRRNFVKARPPYEIEKVEGFLRQYIPSKYTDNYSVDEEAHQGRMSGYPDKATAKALDDGDWDAPTGEFYTEWDEQRHVVTDFIPPQHWYRFRTFDWGTADPAVAYYIAVSDGEPFRDEKGKERWFPRGALIYYREWYVCDEKDPAKGRRLTNEELAQGILQHAEYEHRNVITLTDSLPFNDMGGLGIAATFARQDCILTRGDTSRVVGWSQLRSRLIGKEIDSNFIDDKGKVILFPMIYFCENCRFARDYIPALPRHPSESKKEDAAESGEATHACDAIRLGCMAHPIVIDRKEPWQARINKETSKKVTAQQLIRSSDNDYLSRRN